jgi:hypothetical protein
VGLELAQLGAVGVICVLPDVAGLVDLIDDDLGVSIGDNRLIPREISMRSPWIKASYSTPLLDAL